MKLYFDSLDLVETKGFPYFRRTPIVIRRGAASAHGRAALFDSLLVFLLLQRPRTLLLFYSFLDESDDLGAEFFVKHASRTGGWLKRLRLSLSGRAAPSNRSAGAQPNSSPMSFASGIGSSGSCSRAGGCNGAIAWSSSSLRRSCAGAVMAGQRFGDIEHAVAGAVGARGFPAKSVI
jgi:hypothetical protein